MSKTVLTRAHHAVVDVLLAARLKAGVTQRQLARRLPRWLQWRYTTVGKVEKRRRNLSFVEAREYAKAVGMTVATVDRRATKLAAGRHEAPVIRRPGKRVRLAGGRGT